MGFSILLSPLWSGVTDAYNTNDHGWIKNAVKKYLQIVVLFIMAGVVMLLLSGKVYDLWIGKDKVHIDFIISLLCFTFFSTGMFASIFVSVINGIGALRIQFFTAIIGSIVFVILSLVLIKVFHFGVKSIIISSILTNVFGYIIAPLQVYKIFYKKSKASIWYR
jgi:O-antigen/teichoic acid export membrane protein